MNAPLFVLSPALIWLIAGGILCFSELVFPSAFVEFMMGLSALVVAVVALVVPNVTLQVGLWLILSALSIVYMRRFLAPKRRPTGNLNVDPLEGETLTAIAPGKTGRVMFDGISWQARCADPTMAIAVDETVQIMHQEGTTLIVMPTRIITEGDGFRNF